MNNNEFDNIVHRISEATGVALDDLYSIGVEFEAMIFEATKEAKDKVLIECENKYQAQIEVIKRDLELFKQEQRSEKVSRKVSSTIESPSFRLILFLVLLTVAILFSAFAVSSAPDSATVSIEYNVAEIIGAILGGTGVAVAGLAFASKISTAAKRETESKLDE